MGEIYIYIYMEMKIIQIIPDPKRTCFAFRSAEGLVYLFRLSSKFHTSTGLTFRGPRFVTAGSGDVCMLFLQRRRVSPGAPF